MEKLRNSVKSKYEDKIKKEQEELIFHESGDNTTIYLQKILKYIHDLPPPKLKVIAVKQEAQTDVEVKGVITCPQCYNRGLRGLESKSTIALPMQLRSADESMSSFCLCTKCNYRWQKN